MPAAEQRNEALELVRDRLSKLVRTNPEALARTSELSAKINFKEAVPYFQQMVDLCKQLQERELSRLTTQILQAMGAGCDVLTTLIDEVESFDLNRDKPGDACKDLIRRIGSGYDDVMNPLLLPLAFTATQGTDYGKIEREAKGHQTTMEAQSKKFLIFITETEEQVRSALAAVKEQAAEVGVSTNAQIFLRDSNEHKDSASTWMTRTAIAGAVTLAAAIVALFTPLFYRPPDTAAAIQFLVAKLIVLSTLSFGLFWCARNYKAQKHNQTLNKHRANALMTFRAFVEGTSDARVKDAILLQASQAAFSSRPSGFDTSEKDAQVISPVVEILGKTLRTSAEG